MNRTPWATFLAVTALVLPAYSATITGDVTSDGKAVRGALVTLYSADGLVSNTVFTDAAGRYRLASQLNGALTLRVRAPLNADEIAKLNVPAGDTQLTQVFSLRRLTSSQEISDSLPASAHFIGIKFPTLIARQQFQVDCAQCHQIGNPITRRPRSHEEWTAFMRIMVTNAEYPTDEHVAEYAAVMNRAFDGTPTPAHERTTVDAGALDARITEWKLREAKIAGDTEFYPPDGTFYTCDLFFDQLFVTDPKTNKTTVLPLPALGVPIGGTFAGKDDVPPWVPPVSHGIHSLQLGPDGKFYMTGSIGGEIGVFDPVKRSYQVNRIGGTATYPHTLRIDRHGLVWFSIYVSDQIGRFDPKTGKSTIIQLPTAMARKDDRGPAPYGVDTNPVDGSVWYTKLYGNKVGRVDPKTLQVQEWEPPVIGPRRARFDKAGGFWIPGFGDGKIARLDTKTMTYETYKIPTLADDEVEAPYAVAIDPKTQNVWVTANMSDRMFRFEPKTKTWTAYPLPTRGLFFRDLVITPDGRVCGASDPWPPQQNVIEGGMHSVVCLQPDADKVAGPTLTRADNGTGVLAVNRK
jgi:virginiamycin B lyase